MANSKQSATGYFSPELDYFYYRDLEFKVDYNKRRKRLKLILNSRTGMFTIHAMTASPRNIDTFCQLIDGCLNNMITDYHQVLKKMDQVSQHALHKRNYKENDLFYIWGLPYILEINPNSSIESVFTTEPELVVQNAILKEQSRFAEKYEILRSRGYYHPQALANVPKLENGYLTLPKQCLLKSESYPLYLKNFFDRAQNIEGDLYSDYAINSYLRSAYQCLLDVEQQIKNNKLITNSYFFNPIPTVIRDCYDKYCAFDDSIYFKQATSFEQIPESLNVELHTPQVTQKLCLYIRKSLNNIFKEKEYFPQLMEHNLHKGFYGCLFNEEEPYVYKGTIANDYFTFKDEDVEVNSDYLYSPYEDHPFEVQLANRGILGDFFSHKNKDDFMTEEFWRKRNANPLKDFSFKEFFSSFIPQFSESDPGFDWFKNLHWSMGINEDVAPASFELKSHEQDYKDFIPSLFTIKEIPVGNPYCPQINSDISELNDEETSDDNHQSTTGYKQNLDKLNDRTYSKAIRLFLQQDSIDLSAQADYFAKEDGVNQYSISSYFTFGFSPFENKQNATLLVMRELTTKVQQQFVISNLNKEFIGEQTSEQLERNNNSYADNLGNNNQDSANHNSSLLSQKENEVFLAILNLANTEYQTKYEPYLNDSSFSYRSSLLCHLYYLEIFYYLEHNQKAEASRLTDLIVRKQPLPLYQRSENFKDIFGLQPLVKFSVHFDFSDFTQGTDQNEMAFIQDTFLNKDLDYLRKCDISQDRLMAISSYQEVIIRSEPLRLLKNSDTQKHQTEEFISLFVQKQDILRLEKLKALRQFNIEYKKAFDECLNNHYEQLDPQLIPKFKDLDYDTYVKDTLLNLNNNQLVEDLTAKNNQIKDQASSVVVLNLGNGVSICETPQEQPITEPKEQEKQELTAQNSSEQGSKKLEFESCTKIEASNNNEQALRQEHIIKTDQFINFHSMKQLVDYDVVDMEDSSNLVQSLVPKKNEIKQQIDIANLRHDNPYIDIALNASQEQLQDWEIISKVNDRLLNRVDIEDEEQEVQPLYKNATFTYIEVKHDEPEEKIDPVIESEENQDKTEDDWLEGFSELAKGKLLCFNGQYFAEVQLNLQSKPSILEKYKLLGQEQASYRELLCQSLSYEYGEKQGVFRGEPRIKEGLARTLFAGGKEIDPSLALIGYISPLFMNEQYLNAQNINDYIEPKGARMVAQYATQWIFNKREENMPTMVKTLVKPGRLVVNLKGRWTKNKCKAQIDAFLHQQLQEKAEIIGRCFTDLDVYKNLVNGEPPREYKVDKINAYGSFLPSTGVITFNPMLVTLPYHCLAATLAHELCHLKYTDHSPSFKRLLNVLYPNNKAVDLDLTNTNVFTDK